MEDPNSLEAVQSRASQEDPIVMYFIVRESLGMGTGKACAQTGHAAVMTTLDYFKLKDCSRSLQKSIQSMTESDPDKVKALADYKEIAPLLSIFGEWLSSSYRKVTLTANDKEWAKVKAELGLYRSLVVDAGLTQIPAGSETVIGLWPMRKSQRPPCVKRLQALK